MLKPNQPTLPNTRTTTPAELFGDFVEELAEKYEKDKRLLKDLVKDSGIIVNPGTSYEEFEEAITAHAKLETFEDKAHVHRYFDALKEKAIQKEKSNEKRKRKLIDNFIAYLKRSKIVTPTSTWPEVLDELSRHPHPSFEELASDELREKAFTEYFQQYKAKLESEANENPKPSKKHRSSEKSEKSEKRHKKRHRKSSSKRRDSDSDESHHHHEEEKRHSKRQKSEEESTSREKHKEKDKTKEKEKDKLKDKDKDKEKKDDEMDNRTKLDRDSDKDQDEKESEKQQEKEPEKEHDNKGERTEHDQIDNRNDNATEQAISDLQPTTDGEQLNNDNDQDREKTTPQEKEDGELVGDSMEQ